MKYAKQLVKTKADPKLKPNDPTEPRPKNCPKCNSRRIHPIEPHVLVPVLVPVQPDDDDELKVSQQTSSQQLWVMAVDIKAPATR